MVSASGQITSPKEITSLLVGSKALTSWVTSEPGYLHDHSGQREETAPSTRKGPLSEEGFVAGTLYFLLLYNLSRKHLILFPSRCFFLISPDLGVVGVSLPTKGLGCVSWDGGRRGEGGQWLATICPRGKFWGCSSLEWAWA